MSEAEKEIEKAQEAKRAVGDPNTTELDRAESGEDARLDHSRNTRH